MGPIAAMAAIVALAGSGIYIGLKSLGNYKPNKKRIQKDLKLLKVELATLALELVPWTEEEMGLLSFNSEAKKVSKGMDNVKKGVFTTIYHEPVIAWVHKSYLSSKENTLTFARTSHHEFTYRKKNDLTDVVVDLNLLGQIRSDGVLYEMKGGKALAYIKKSEGGLGNPIWVGNKEVGRMAKVDNSKVANPRVFQIIGQMDPEEEVKFLALVINEII